MANLARMRGVVYSIAPNRGFAFARGTDGLTRFLHVKSFMNLAEFDMLKLGQEVEFTPARIDDEPKGNGLRGVAVEVVK